MASLKPYHQISSYAAETDMREAQDLLARLAEQQGLELQGGLYDQPRAVPPIDSATILAGGCMLLARKRGPLLEVSLNAVEGEACPERMTTIFADVRRSIRPS